MDVLRLGSSPGGLVVPLFRGCSSVGELVLEVDDVETPFDAGDAVSLQLGAAVIEFEIDGAVAAFEISAAQADAALDARIDKALVTYTPAGGDPVPWFFGETERHYL